MEAHFIASPFGQEKEKNWMPVVAGDAVIVTETPGRLADIANYIRDLDVRTPQVAIKAKIIAVDRTGTEQLGISYDLGSANTFSNALLPRNITPGNEGNLIAEIRELVVHRRSRQEKDLGLDAGADDYLIKPFAFAEFSARVRALLRRGTQLTTKLTLADLEMDTSTRQVRRAGTVILAISVVLWFLSAYPKAPEGATPTQQLARVVREADAISRVSQGW